MLSTAAITAISLGFVSVSEAQDMSVMLDLQKNCMADTKKLCSTELAKPERLMQCLLNNQPNFVPTCGAASGQMAKTLSLKPNSPKRQSRTPIDGVAKNTRGAVNN
jgi:hypothetical protein